MINTAGSIHSMTSIFVVQFADNGRMRTPRIPTQARPGRCRIAWRRRQQCVLRHARSSGSRRCRDKFGHWFPAAAQKSRWVRHDLPRGLPDFSDQVVDAVMNAEAFARIMSLRAMLPSARSSRPMVRPCELVAWTIPLTISPSVSGRKPAAPGAQHRHALPDDLAGCLGCHVQNLWRARRQHLPSSTLGSFFASAKPQSGHPQPVRQLPSRQRCTASIGSILQ